MLNFGDAVGLTLLHAFESEIRSAGKNAVIELRTRQANARNWPWKFL